MRTLGRSAWAALLLLALAGCMPGAGNSEQSKANKPRKARVHLVEIATVEQRTLRSTSTHTGSLRYRTTVRVFNQEEGRLLALPWFEGDRVASGESLFQLDAALLRAELEKAEAVFAEATANVERSRRLRARRMVSDEDNLRASTALEVARAERSVLRTRLGFTRARAPFDALVTARLVEPGDVVPRHTHLLTLADPSSLVTEIDVSERLIPHLRRGAPVEVRIDALGPDSFAGKVLRIHPELNSRTRQGRVEIGLGPVPTGARAGLFTRVTFRVEALERRVMPFAAVRRDRDGEYVFRLDPENRAHRAAIRGGRRLGNQVEVLEGLQAGDRVVTKGFLGLKPGKTLTPVQPPAEGVASRSRGAGALSEAPSGGSAPATGAAHKRAPTAGTSRG